MIDILISNKLFIMNPMPIGNPNPSAYIKKNAYPNISKS